jgi:phosphate transport system permease protein
MIRLYKFIRKRDAAMRIIFLLCALFSLVSLAVITCFLLANGIPFIAETGFFKFLFGMRWAPLADDASFGIFPMLVASVYITVLAAAIGLGLGLPAAVCLYKFFPKKLLGAVKQLINLTAGIPSVVFGLFGMTVIVPFLRDYVSGTGMGYGILAAGLVLALMILPTVVSLSLEALNAVPAGYYDGALALGSTKAQATFRIMLPAAKSGILAATVLAVGRAIGETMAVIMVIGGSPQMPTGMFQSVRTLTANIAMGATEMSGKPLSALIATGVVLFALTLLINVGFSLLRRTKDNPAGRKKPKGKA